MDSALQIRPHVWEMFWLPIHLIRGHWLPLPEELPTIRGGRPQWVILLIVMTSKNALGQPFLNGNLDRGSKGGSGISWATLSGIAPALSAWTWMEDQTEELPPANLTHPHHPSLPVPKLDCWCLSRIQSCLQHSPKILDVNNVRPIKS